MSDSDRELNASFVVPWYGAAIPGGAEAEARRTAQNLAAAGVRVRVLTTCLGGLGTDWDHDVLPPGESREEGIPVLRFPSDRRDGARFNRLNERVIAGESLTPAEEAEFFRHMVHSRALFAHIAAHPGEGPFFFIPYLFTTAVWGPLIHPAKSVLIPCLHDEGYARLASVRRAFESARAVAFHVPAERDLAARLYDLEKTEALVLGEGVDADWQGDPARFRRKYGVTGPFVLYAGRKDAGKNVPLLCRYFARYVAERQGAGGLTLLTIGNLPAPIPPGAEGCIRDLGFVDKEDKYDAYAAAAVLVQPSLMESFSLVIMESWLAGVPVMVHAGCAVTKEHVEQSGGGLHFADYPHFAEGLDLLMADPALRQGLGAAGRRYVLANFAWPVITGRFRDLVARLAGEPTPPARALPSGDGLRPAASCPATPRPARRPGVPAVHQMLPDFALGDAIGNDALALRGALRELGFASEIYAQHVHERLCDQARPVEAYPAEADPGDLLIFHFSIGHPLADRLAGLPGRKVLRYHNITPAHFLEKAFPDAARRARLGREQLPRLAALAELALGVSAYNCTELTAAGAARVRELPILLDLDHLATPPEPAVLNRLAGEEVVLHVGRFAPNKKLEDLVKVQYWLARLRPRARLVLVGGGYEGGRSPYGGGLKALVAELGVPGVEFAGRATQAELTAYYRAAGVYLCLSEHEGFCVPLLEAMRFGLPIVAHASAGIPGTLGEGGILLPGKDPVLVAELLARLLADPPLREAWGRAAAARLPAFHPDRVKAGLRDILTGELGLELPHA